MKHTENFKGFVNERMVKPSRGHNYYVLNKDVPVKYIASQSNPTGATGVLLHNKKGYIDGKEGAYIIDYFGGHYYVDMENKFASYIYKLKDQDRGFSDALTEVDEAPEHADWRGFMREIPFEKNNNNMKHLKGYNDFLNEKWVWQETGDKDDINYLSGSIDFIRNTYAGVAPKNYDMNNFDKDLDKVLRDNLDKTEEYFAAQDREGSPDYGAMQKISSDWRKAYDKVFKTTKTASNWKGTTDGFHRLMMTFWAIHMEAKAGRSDNRGYKVMKRW